MRDRPLSRWALTALCLACTDGASEGSAHQRDVDVGRSTPDARVVPNDIGGELVVDSAVSDQSVGDLALGDVGPVDAAVVDRDARPLRRASEQPTEGASNVQGAADLRPAVEPLLSRAGRVDTDEEKLTGPEANCRLGDFRLDNELISVCIQDEDTYGIFSFFGGTIIDAHRASRPGTDLLQEIVIAPGIGSATAEHVGIVRDGSDRGPAILRVEGRAMPSRLIQGVLAGLFVPPDFKVTTEYRLSPGADHVEIYTWIEADVVGGSAPTADVIFFGDRTRFFVPGGLPDRLIAAPVAYLAASSVSVSYAIKSLDGPFSFVAIPTSETPVPAVNHGDVGLNRGDQVLLRRVLVVGTGDVESVRPPVADGLPTVIVGPSGASLDVLDDQGRTVSRLTLGDDGRGVVSLVPGRYRVLADRAWAGGAMPPLDFNAGDEVIYAAGAPGVLRVRVRDPLGNPVPARLTLQREGQDRRIFFAVDADTFVLPIGPWQMTTTHGFHSSVDVREVLVEAAAEPVPVEVTLEDQLPFEGLTSGEFHQHASPSADSDVDVELRVLSNVAEGVGFMAPSEHDVLYDFGGLVNRMGLSDRIMVFLGTEVSPIYGHFGAYGLEPRPDESGGGGVMLPVLEDGRWRIRRPPELAAAARELGASVLQINHGRSAPSGYFTHLGYETGQPFAELDQDEFTQDFDSMEIMNESGDFCALTADWMSLLNQGWRILAVGNSDTHSVSKPPGWPRNYLPTRAATPQGVQAGEIIDAFRQGNMTIGGGGTIDFPDGPQPGSTLVPVDGGVLIRVRLRTPTWTRLTRLVAFVNGRQILDRALVSEDSALVDLDEVIRFETPVDGHLELLAVGPPLPFIAPGEPTFAVANALWIDADGGGITPVGPGPIDRLVTDFCD